MVLTIRLIGPMDQVDLNGVHEVLVHPSTLHMIISNNEDRTSPGILSTLLHMGVILNIWVLEVALVLVGSKGHLQTCRGCLHMAVVMITMADTEGKPQHNILLVALLPTLQWVDLHPKQTTIMDIHMVHTIGSQLLIPILHLLSMAMGMDMKNQNMIIILQLSTPMEDMELLSRIHKLELSQAMVRSSILVSHQHIPCHLRVHLPSLMVLPLWLANQEKRFIRPQLSHMVRVSQLNSHIHMHPLHLHSSLMLRMVLPQLLMGIISHQLLQPVVIHSKEGSLLVMVSLHLAMHKQLQQDMHNTQRPNKVILSNLLHILGVMGTKGLKILPMVQLQLRNRALLNQHLQQLGRSRVTPSQHRQQLNKLMISLSRSRVFMGKQCHLSLATLSTTRVKCMPHLVE